MRVSSVLFIVVVLISLISLLSIWFYPSIEDFMASNTMWNGIKNFNQEFGADNLNSLDELPALPEAAVLVAIPYLTYTDEELAKLKRFVEDGGTLLLMDDYGYGNSVLAYLGVDVRFSNKPLLDPLFNYRNQRLPKIIDFVPKVKEDGINTVVLNHATALTNVELPAVIAWSSAASFLDMNEDESRDGGEPRGPLAVTAEFRLGKGRLVPVADPSIVINSMVGRDDNYSFIRYLISPKSEPREILVDSSHLPQAPLDVSKTRLIKAHQILANPYTLIGLTVLIFMVVSKYTLKKGETIG